MRITNQVKGQRRGGTGGSGVTVSLHYSASLDDELVWVGERTVSRIELRAEGNGGGFSVVNYGALPGEIERLSDLAGDILEAVAEFKSVNGWGDDA